MARKPDKRKYLVGKSARRGTCLENSVSIIACGSSPLPIAHKEYYEMKCLVCKKQIQSYEEYEIYGLDGDFIHLDCKPKMEELIKCINEMSEEEFIRWLCE